MALRVSYSAWVMVPASRIWEAFSQAATRTSLAILNGQDAARIPRYMAYMQTLPLYREWITAAQARDSAIAERQRTWQSGRAR